MGSNRSNFPVVYLIICLKHSLTLSRDSKMTIIYWSKMFQCKSCPFSCINVVIARSEEQLDLKDEIKINVTDQ